MEKERMCSLKLIKNEFRKVVNFKNIFSVSLVLIVIFILFALLLEMDADVMLEGASAEEVLLYEKIEEATDWRERYQLRIQLYEILEDVYGKEYVDMKRSVLQYRLDNNIAPNKTGNNAFNFISHTFSSIGFIIVIIASLFFTKVLDIEYHNKTEKILYTKPYSRINIHISKYIFSTVLVFFLICFCYLVLFLIGGIFFSYEGYNAVSVVYFNNKILKTTIIGESLIYLLIIFINSFICGTISYVFCNVLHSRMGGLGIGLVIYFIGNSITQKIFESGAKWIVYVPFSYSDWMMFIDNPLNSSFRLSYAIFLNVVMLITFILISCVVIKKRDIK